MSRPSSWVESIVAVKASILAGGIFAYASENNDNKLAVRADYSPSDLYKLRDSDFPKVVSEIIQAANENLTALADQGVTKEQVTDVETSLDDYRPLIGLARTITVEKGTAGAEVDQLIDGTNVMLRDQLDKSMLRFRLTDAAFYDGYQRARTIVDR